MTEERPFDFHFSSEFFRKTKKATLLGDVILRVHIVKSLILQKILPAPGFVPNPYNFSLRDLFRLPSDLVEIYRQKLAVFFDRDFMDIVWLFLHGQRSQEDVILDFSGVPKFSVGFLKELNFDTKKAKTKEKLVVDLMAREFLAWIQKQATDGKLEVPWAVFEIRGNTVFAIYKEVEPPSLMDRLSQ